MSHPTRGIDIVAASPLEFFHICTLSAPYIVKDLLQVIGCLHAAEADRVT